MLDSLSGGGQGQNMTVYLLLVVGDRLTHLLIGLHSMNKNYAES